MIGRQKNGLAASLKFKYRHDYIIINKEMIIIIVHGIEAKTTIPNACCEGLYE